MPSPQSLFSELRIEEVILTLCLFAVVDLCSMHSLSLAVKYSVLALLQQMDV